MKILKALLCSFLCWASNQTLLAQEFIPLWEKGKMPNSKGLSIKDSIANERVYRVGTPGMYAFFPSNQENKGAAVVICPGGGYERLAYVISGFQLAKWFNTMGVSAFVLNYRLPNSPDLINREIGPLQDAQRAIKYIRSNASKWGIKPDKVGIQGSSAGGHLASLAGVSTKDIASVGDSLDKFSAHPDFMILVSPVVDLDKYAHKGSRKNLLGENPSQELVKQYSIQHQVTPKACPAFIVCAFNDNAVDAHNSLMLYQSLLENKVSSALHIFPQGAHAIALRNNPGSAEIWTEICEKWLSEIGILVR